MDICLCELHNQERDFVYKCWTRKLLVQLVVIFTDHFFEFSKHNDCKHCFTLFCGPLGNHAMAHWWAIAHWLGNTDLKHISMQLARCDGILHSAHREKRVNALLPLIGNCHLQCYINVWESRLPRIQAWWNQGRTQKFIKGARESDFLQILQNGGVEDPFLEINIQSAKLRDARVTVTQILAELTFKILMKGEEGLVRERLLANNGWK